MIAERDAHHLLQLEEFKRSSELQHREDIERIQNILMSELREVQEKYAAAQSALDASLQGRASPAKPSLIGHSLIDDNDEEKAELLKQIDELKQQVALEQVWYYLCFEI